MEKARRILSQITNREAHFEDAKRVEVVVTEDEIKNYNYIFSDAHFNMLSDTARLRPLREAIFQTIKPNDIVADLGAGTGILSIFAAKKATERILRGFIQPSLK